MRTTYKLLLDHNFRVVFCDELNKLIISKCSVQMVDGSYANCFNIYVGGMSNVGYIKLCRYIGYIELFDECIKLKLGAFLFKCDYFKDFITEIAIAINRHVMEFI